MHQFGYFSVMPPAVDGGNRATNPKREPKTLSPTDPSAAWTSRGGHKVMFGYRLNYLIVRGESGKEMVFFPDYGSNATIGPAPPRHLVPFRLAGVHPQSSFNPDVFYFTAIILPGSRSSPARAAKKIGACRSVLLRNARGQ